MAGFRVLMTVEMVTNAPTPEAAAAFAAETVAMGRDCPLSLRDARLLVQPLNQDPYGPPDSWEYTENDFAAMVGDDGGW